MSHGVSLTTFGGLILKIRLVSSLALAGAVVLGASGCSLIAPVATEKVYAPSDGINADVADLKLRNMLLVAGDDHSAFNVVFTAVNSGEREVPLTLSFDGDSAETVQTVVPRGSTKFGHPEDDGDLLVVDLGSQRVGSTVTAYLEAGTGKSVRTKVPVLDGTLDEYKQYVLSESDVKQAKQQSGSDAAGTESGSTGSDSGDSGTTTGTDSQ